MRKSRWTMLVTFVSALAVAPLQADEPKMPQGQEDQAAMMDAWMKMTQPNENHKLLQKFEGKWTYVAKMFMDPSSEPSESTGKSEMRVIMDGRYVHAEHEGTMMMPGADGQMEKFEFKGAGVTGYDNVKKKFVNSWVDNMGTGILMSEGDYDAATKTFTYHAEMDDPFGGPNAKVKVKEVIKWLSDDKHVFEWWEQRDGDWTKMMEITYTKK